MPREPQWPGWYSLTHVGPIAFTVADCRPDALGDGRARIRSIPISLPPLGGDLAAAGRADGDLRGLRIAYSEDLGYISVDPGVREAFRRRDRAVPRARRRAARRPIPGLPNPIETWNTIACVDNLASEGPLLETGLVGEDTRELIEAGARLQRRRLRACPQRAGRVRRLPGVGSWSATT